MVGWAPDPTSTAANPAPHDGLFVVATTPEEETLFAALCKAAQLKEQGGSTGGVKWYAYADIFGTFMIVARAPIQDVITYRPHKSITAIEALDRLSAAINLIINESEIKLCGDGEWETVAHIVRNRSDLDRPDGDIDPFELTNNDFMNIAKFINPVPPVVPPGPRVSRSAAEQAAQPDSQYEKDLAEYNEKFKEPLFISDELSWGRGSLADADTGDYKAAIVYVMYNGARSKSTAPSANSSYANVIKVLVKQNPEFEGLSDGAAACFFADQLRSIRWPHLLRRYANQGGQRDLDLSSAVLWARENGTGTRCQNILLARLASAVTKLPRTSLATEGCTNNDQLARMLRTLTNSDTLSIDGLARLETKLGAPTVGPRLSAPETLNMETDQRVDFLSSILLNIAGGNPSQPALQAPSASSGNPNGERTVKFGSVSINNKHANTHASNTPKAEHRP